MTIIYPPLYLKNFINRHEGETCYLFGDGPSIKSFDYSAFSDHIGISCGMQIFHKDFNRLNVKYYSLIEPYLFYPDWIILSKRLQYLKKHRIITNEFKHLIKLNTEITFFINLSNIFSIYEKNIRFLHSSILKKFDAFRALKKININPCGNSFYTVISIAKLMGFKKVFLVGFDAHTIKNSSYRWYENETDDNSRKTVFMKDDILEIYSKDMEIVNISSEGTNCNVSHLDYSEHTGKGIEVKKNIDLINPKNLDLLKQRFDNI